VIKVRRFLKGLFYNEEGQTMTEYIIIVVLIAVAAIVVLRLFGEQIRDLFTGAKDTIENETGSVFP
jgi:Flp pilus assembly pilin Flp